MSTHLSLAAPARPHRTVGRVGSSANRRNDLVCNASSPSQRPSGTSAPLRYLYDSDCPLRRPEVEMLQVLDRGQGRIEFVDVAKLDYQPLENQGITYKDAMGQPAAILSDGSVIRSVEVYKKLYEAVGLGFVWRAAELPVVGDAVEWVFDRTVEYRLRVTGRPDLEQLVAEREAALARKEG